MVASTGVGGDYVQRGEDGRVEEMGGRYTYKAQEGHRKLERIQ